MDGDQLDDLKQFITATVSQTEQRLSSEIGELRLEVRDGFAGVSEAVEGINQHQTEQDTRLSTLESV